jgi:hypothetical protein
MLLVVFLVAPGAGPAAAADAGVAPRRQLVAGKVVDGNGRPLQNVLVFAADAASDAVAAVAVSDDSGLVQLTVPARRHNFGVLSATLGVTRLIAEGAAHFQLVLAPLPPGGGSGKKDPPAAHIDAPRAYVVRGRVVDEAGMGLGGMRLEASRATGTVTATAFSAADGSFALVVPGGPSDVRASAPGFKTLRSAQQRGRLVVVMAIAAQPQVLNLTAGHLLSFSPSDSIDPEYTPPAPVKAWLQYAYGICPASTPLKLRERQALKKYWYLDVLRRAPPNPASVSTVTCTPPTSYQPPPLPGTNLGGFEIWPESLPTSELK